MGGTAGDEWRHCSALGSGAVLPGLGRQHFLSALGVHGWRRADWLYSEALWSDPGNHASGYGDRQSRRRLRRQTGLGVDCGAFAADNFWWRYRAGSRSVWCNRSTVDLCQPQY